MPEAVIVAAARSPIGRAFKGSLKDVRADEIAVSIVQAALDQVPALDPKDIDDLMLGCGMPGGEAGFNLARIVSVLLGHDNLPGTTVNRYCSSSLQTTRMAMHAIKAGEGDVFISAGVEMVSRHLKGTSDTLPYTQNPIFDEAQTRTASRAGESLDVSNTPGLFVLAYTVEPGSKTAEAMSLMGSWTAKNPPNRRIVDPNRQWESSRGGRPDQSLPDEPTLDQQKPANADWPDHR